MELLALKWFKFYPKELLFLYCILAFSVNIYAIESETENADEQSFTKFSRKSELQKQSIITP